MKTIVIIAIITLAICGVGGISGFCGWELLEDKDWFWRLHRDSKIKKNIILALLSTIGIPFIWGYLTLGTLMLVCVQIYELARYGGTDG